uniref:SHSP domain-containing protein n=1 Tax=Globodera pallida TaxID=36090 RepID=A0A183C0P2_GLOPA
MTAIPVKRDLFTSSLFSSPNSKPEFEVELDVQQFAPNEIDVKVSGDDVVVNCLHESKVNHIKFGTLCLPRRASSEKGRKA